MKIDLISWDKYFQKRIFTTDESYLSQYHFGINYSYCPYNNIEILKDYELIPYNMNRIKLSITDIYDIYIKTNETLILNICHLQAFKIDGINTIEEINNIIKTHLSPKNNMNYDVCIIGSEDNIIDVIPIQEYIDTI